MFRMSSSMVICTKVVYIEPPPRLRRQGENTVCRLNKSLYELEQASRNWFSKFSGAIQQAGFHQSKADYLLFTKVRNNSFTAVLIYVDEILLTGMICKKWSVLNLFSSSIFASRTLVI
ncbi:unnamed protein product [Prunus brigantina]